MRIRLTAAALLAAALAPRPSRAQIASLEITAGSAPGARPSGAALALNALGETQAERLAGTLERLERAVTRRKNPLFVPLDDSAERAEVEALFTASGPLAAAVALSAGRWQSPDKDLTLRAVPRCTGAARCVRLGEPGEKLAPRERFLAWPLGYALVVTAGSAREAGGLAARLRERAGPEARIALVLTAEDLPRLRRSPAVDRLLRSARRLAPAAAGGSLAPALGTLLSAARARPEVPWLRLPPDVVLVVPRLGALAAADAFVAEVRAVAPAATWLSPP